MNNNYSVIVIGGGPAGMMAAGCATKYGKTLLVEKGRQLGSKLLITGRGRCNFTNISEIKEFVESYGKNGKFLYRAFTEFFNQDLIDFFNRYGVKSKVERGGRLFPVSDDAKSIVKALRSYLRDSNVDIRLNQKVSRLILTKQNGQNGVRKVHGVVVNNKRIRSDSVIIATGGLSYPLTGSTGDGHLMAEEAGHTIVPLKPALAPLETREKYVKQLQGLSLRNVQVAAFVNGRAVTSEFGEMLFTHFGLSGPVIIKMSRDLVKHFEKKEQVFISINLKPALKQDKLNDRLLREFRENGLKAYKNVLKSLLPSKMIPLFIKLSDIPESTKCNQITRAQREKIKSLLMDFRFSITGPRPVQEAIVTKGGVSLGEIEPRTMESKKVKGLYFCGEVIDIDGKTGGYNLQAAFSTGYLAGKSAISL